MKSWKRRANTEKITAYLCYYTFPEWSYNNKKWILFCTVISLLGGIAGSYLSHSGNTYGILAWHIGMFALMVCFICFLRGTYQKYMDRGWDTYY